MCVCERERVILQELACVDKDTMCLIIMFTTGLIVLKCIVLKFIKRIRLLT